MTIAIAVGLPTIAPSWPTPCQTSGGDARLSPVAAGPSDGPSCQGVDPGSSRWRGDRDPAPAGLTEESDEDEAIPSIAIGLTGPDASPPGPIPSRPTPTAPVEAHRLLPVGSLCRLRC